MSASKVRADYHALGQIAQQFNRQSESTRQMLQQMHREMSVLRNGDWLGKGSAKFYQEMSSAVLPSLSRLAAALEAAAQTTQQISTIMKQAEGDAARCFRLDGAGVATANSGMAALSSLASPMGRGVASGDGATAPPRRKGRDVYSETGVRKGVKKLVDEKLLGVRNRQIGEAIKKYEIDLSVATHVIYDPNLQDYGTTDPDGTIRIGPRAFEGSPGFLAATIYHETQHIRQWNENRWRYSGPPPWDNVQLGAMNEIEAYNRELANADRFGLTEDERSELKNYRDKAYLELTKENQDRANKGNYTIK